jgi:hypothetical protein
MFFSRKKTHNLDFFCQPRWWLKYGLANETSFTVAGNVLYTYFLYIQKGASDNLSVLFKKYQTPILGFSFQSLRALDNCVALLGSFSVIFLIYYG